MYNRFIIVGTQRTGSSFVATSIEQHPDIACGWEWTLDVPIFKKKSAAKKALNCDFSNLSNRCQEHMATFTQPIKTIGFRWLFSSSPKWWISPYFSPSRQIERLPGLYQILQQDPSIKVIHITRNDDIGWLVSLFSAKQSGVFIGAKHKSDLKINIPVELAKKRIIAKRNLDYVLKSSKSHNPYLEIDYSEIESNSSNLLKKVFDFLEVENTFSPSDTIMKQQTRPHSDIVENYDQLYQCISGIKCQR